MPFYSKIFQPVALAAPDEERIDGHGADAQLGHNGPAAGAQQLALLDIVPGLDVQCGQAVEDAPEARAVVDDDGVAVAAAKVSSTWPLAGTIIESFDFFGLMTTFVEVRPP
jgi:hypothetical protein